MVFGRRPITNGAEQKKRMRRPSSGKTETVTLRLSPAELGFIDAWCKARGISSRSEAIRRLRVGRCVTKVRDGIPSRLMEPSSTSHRLRPYRSSNPTDRRAAHCILVPPCPTTLGGDNWTMADRRLSPYRSRASPKRKLPAFSNFARPRYRAHAPSEPQSRRLYCMPRTTRSRPNDPQCPSPTRRPFFESVIADKVMRNDSDFWLVRSRAACHAFR